eukprot:TRINITY_DN31596_c0_g2_i1.p1 TRINITY_DN31596_c0_g2~~TRINITY_DN31596_c0_g2_i1.p1  ORF type:complete len:432 (+),score=75.97 TRINITY_DN31596_c0_g2_i1:62-1357(+)
MLGSLISLLAIFAASCHAGAARSDRQPVVLIPGLVGSAMEVKMHKAHMPHIWCTTDTKDEWMKVWLDPTEAIPKEKDCLLARMTLTYNSTSDTYSNFPGVDLRAAGWKTGIVDGKKSLDSLYKYEFDPMIKHLEDELGYELGSDLLIAPYDWRLAGDAHSNRQNGVGGFYAQLQSLLEQAVRQQGKKAVVLSHSLGCPTTLDFFHRYVSEEWRAKHIQGWVALSGPWMGSTTQVAAYLGGYTLGMPKWLFPHDYVKPVQVNATSGVWLSPHPKAFGSRTLVRTPSQNYTAADVQKLISLVGEEAGGDQILALFKKPRLDLASIQSAPVNVPVLNWYSTGVKTADAFRYDKDISFGFDEGATETIYGDGDGIVNLVSLQHVETAWPASGNVSTNVFPNVSHFGMLSDKRVLSALTEYLTWSGEAVSETEVFV